MLERLNAEFGISDEVTFVRGEGGFPKAVLQHESGSSATVYCYGAHVASWRNATGNELLFESSKVVYTSGKAIRGGIPIIFPQFSKGPLPSHGLARISEWEVLRSAKGTDDALVLTLRLRDTESSRALWPSRFECLYEVRLNETLCTKLTVRNSGNEAFQFTEALHSYFRVGKIDAVVVKGLAQASYLDSLRDRVTCAASGAELAIAGEVDRIYLDTPPTLEIVDQALGRRIVIEKENYRDTVVWNPWIERSKTFSDLGEEDFRYFVCVEVGNIAMPISLSPGNSFVSTQRLSSRPLAA